MIPPDPRQGSIGPHAIRSVRNEPAARPVGCLLTGPQRSTWDNESVDRPAGWRAPPEGRGLATFCQVVGVLMLSFALSNASTLSAQPSKSPPHRAMLTDSNSDQNQGLRVQFSERWFDATCFGQLTEAMARRHCQEVLDQRIELAAASASLTSSQRAKLRSAGRVDIHRFFAAYHSFKRQFEFGLMAQVDWQSRVDLVVSQGAIYSRRITAGLHGQESLYAKVLHSTIPEESAARVQRDYRAFAERRYRGEIAAVVDQIFGGGASRKPSASFVDVHELAVDGQAERTDQAGDDAEPAITVGDRIADRLVETTEPPEFYGNSRHRFQVISARLAELDDEFDPFLTLPQRQRLRTLQPLPRPPGPAEMGFRGREPVLPQK